MTNQDSQQTGYLGTPRTTRSDYASTRVQKNGAWISRVEPGSPADIAGIYPGLCIETVNGVPMDDIITWRWEGSGATVDLDLVDQEGVAYEVELFREPGQSWGIEFEDVLFDGIRTCRNACLFCFMGMLPPEARSSLLLRDDDYRLSFLQGNFVTLTNVSDQDVDRIISWRLEPMNVSLHAITPDVRRHLIGRNEARGREALEQLCDAGIEVHAQIVLCPHINDGEELLRTLTWVEEHPNITSLAIVPMGYTKYSKAFSSSYSDDLEASRSVIEIVRPFQERARKQRGKTVFQLSDEFYLDAQVEVPPAYTYDGYPQFYDGIGMLRSFIDETEQVLLSAHADIERLQSELKQSETQALLICGEAAFDVISRLCHTWQISDSVRPFAIRNDYYGGDVNVTGLVVATDLLSQLPQHLNNVYIVLPETMLNFDHMTLDDWSLNELSETIAKRGGVVSVCETSPAKLLAHLMEHLGYRSVSNGVE